MTSWTTFSVLLASLLAGDTPPITVERSSQPMTLSPADLRRQLPSSPRVEPSQAETQSQVVEKLRQHSAVREARELLSGRRFADAMQVLEPCLDAAESCPELLISLESAYRGQIAELLARGASQEASLVAERLRAISRNAFDNFAIPGIARERQPAPAEPLEAASQDDEATPPSRGPVAAMGKMGRQVIDSVQSILPESLRRQEEPSNAAASFEARGKLDTDQTASPASALTLAAELFQQGRYPEALVAYERAYAEDPVSVQNQRVRWGYCLLVVTIDRYNELLDQDPSQVDIAIWEELRNDATTAAQLAPRIEYCKTVVQAIDQRVAEAGRRPADGLIAASATNENTQAYGLTRIPTQAFPFRHLPGQSTQWQAAETTNFVIMHRNPQLAEEVGQLAERARALSQETWFRGEPAPDWQPKCQLYLHPTAHDYGNNTGVPAESPGHSKVVNNAGMISSREVHLRCDDPNMKHAVLVHEITHVVLAGRFGSHSLPRWADEGMAVLTEPMDKQNAHLVNLARTHALGRAYTCGQVMTMGQYPGGDRMRDFYAHSVGICRYLVERGGHQQLVQFLRRSLDSGNYQTSLQETYGLTDFPQLEAGFRDYVSNIAGVGASAMATR